MDPLQYQAVPYIFSSTSLTWDATTFPSTTSSTIVLIFLVLVGSKQHKQDKRKYYEIVNMPCIYNYILFPFKLATCYDELYDVVKQNSIYYFTYNNDFRNNIIGTFHPSFRKYWEF